MGKGYRKVTPQLLNVYSKPDRDPRMRVMSLAYVAVVNAAEVNVKAGDDAAEAGWFRINMTRTAINRENGVITYHLELTRGDICLTANLDYRRWYGVLTDNEGVDAARQRGTGLRSCEDYCRSLQKVAADDLKKGKFFTKM